MDEAFDLYVYKRCAPGTDEDALLELLPPDASPSVIDLLLGPRPPAHDGFMGFDLPVGKAYALKHHLHALGATVILLPSRYRTPRLTVEQAHALAQQEIQHLITHDKQVRGYAFDPVEPTPRSEHPTCWTFGAPSPQLQEEGFIPGVAFATIDKWDGHVHQPREALELEEEWEALGHSAREGGPPKLPRELRQRRKRRESSR